MVTTADSSSNHQSPTTAAFSGDSNSKSPKFPRKNLPSPWAQVVRGGEPESIFAAHQSPPSSSSSPSTPPSSQGISLPDQTGISDGSPKGITLSLPLDNPNTCAADSSDAGNGNAGRSKKPAWNVPSNGVLEVGPVMGAVSWPALSESTKAPAKVSDEPALKTVKEGPSSDSQRGHATSCSPQEQAPSLKAIFSTNHAMPNRQKSMKRGGGNNHGSRPPKSNFIHPPTPPPPPPFPLFQIPPTSYGNMVPGTNWNARPVGGFVSQPQSDNDHRNSSSRGNLGPHNRGERGYHNSYGCRRDHDRGNQANTRDAHSQQPRAPPRGLVRAPPPNTTAFVSPPPMGFPEFYYFPTLPLEPFRGMPFFTHGPPPAMFYPAAEPPLTIMLMNQIEYYFSDANLVKDDFLRSNMDDQGWVPINLIASFPRVRSLTSNIQLILDSLRSSAVVEVQGNKVRRQNEWKKWLPSSQIQTNLAAKFEKISVEESSSSKDDADSTAVAGSGKDSTEPQLPNGDMAE